MMLMQSQPEMAIQRTYIMIYIAHSDLQPGFEGNTFGHLAGKTDGSNGRNANAGQKVQFQPAVSATSKNRSLIFGTSITSDNNSDATICKKGLSVGNFVERPWYGRALVNLRTYPQWAVRTTAMHKKLTGSYHQSN
jgi:hypothetical protein